jgi:hypothetical protein
MLPLLCLWLCFAATLGAPAARLATELPLASLDWLSIGVVIYLPIARLLSASCAVKIDAI